MKTCYLLIGFIGLVIVALLYWLRPQNATSSPRVSQQAGGDGEEPARPTENPLVESNGSPIAEATPGSTAKHSVSAEMAEFVRRTQEDPTYEWRHPINFYGKVVDENEEPVNGAQVDFVWNDLSPEGSSRATTTSDPNGCFSLLDRTGKALSVSAGKEGYYSTRDARHVGFEYAYPEWKFIPDANRPVIFHLRKKRAGVDLVTSEYGVKKHLGVEAPLDGAPVWVDLLRRSSGAAGGHLVFSQSKPPYESWKQATEWSFRMEIPDGGFIEHDEEFPFEAPETGYEPVVEFNFQAEQPDWSINIQQDYYIKFGTPPRYGRLHLETGITMKGARLTYAINPDGSRNLEPK